MVHPSRGVSPATPGAPGAGASFRWWAAGLVVLAVVLAYANSLSAPLVLDDYYSITENPTIRQVWPPGPALTPPAKSGTGGRPLANFSYAVSYALSREQPWGHHVVGVGVHALAALALLGVVRRTLLLPALRAAAGTQALSLATLVALLWAVHPLQTQVVTYVSQRTESLMALCYLLTLYAFIRGTEGRARLWHGLAVVACWCGMACKEVMVTAPVVVLLYDRVLVAGSFATALRARWRLYLGLASAWLALAWLMIGVKERDVGFGLGASAFDYALTACQALVVYLRLALWPQPLIFDRGPALVTSFAAALPWIAVLLGLAAGVVLAWRRRPALGFAAAWFFLLLAPTTSVVPIVQQPLAENRPHLALAGLLALLVVALYGRIGRWVWVAGGAAVVVGVIATAQRNRTYATEVGLWRDTVEKAPGNVRAHHNLGAAWQKSGQRAEAIAAYESALALDPRYFYAHASLAATLGELGRDAEAIPHFREALRLEPRQPKVYVNFGISLFRSGHTKEGLEQLERGVALDPGSADAHYNLGTARHFLGRTAEAIAQFRQAVELDPRMVKAWNNLGLALQQQGEVTEAIATYERALRAAGESPDTHHNLANALGNAGRIPEAIPHWEAALALNPALTTAREALAQGRQLLANPGGARK